MGQTVTVAALFSFLGICWGHSFIFLSSYLRLKTGDPKMNQADGGSLLPDCTDLLRVFETFVVRDHGSSCDPVTTGRVCLEQAPRLCQPVSALVKTWSTVLCRLHQRIDVKLK